MKHKLGFALRALLVIFLFVFFYAFTLFVVVALMALPVYMVLELGRINFYVIGICYIGAFSILVAMFPRKEKFIPPGILIRGDRYREISAAVAAIAEDLGQQAPREIYLLPEPDAWIGKRDTMSGFGGKTILGIGVPLILMLPGPELGAVIAHELGHFSRKDTSLGPTIYTLHNSLSNIIEQLTRNTKLIDGIFILFAKLFRLVTSAVSRRQETVADEIACRYAGSRRAADALRSVVGVQKRFAAYWNKYYSPALARGYVPPFLEGFCRFLQNGRECGLAERMPEPKGSRYSSHPELGKRIARMEAKGEAGSGAAREASVPLEKMTTALEDDCAAVFKHRSVQNIIPLKWEEAGEKAYRFIFEKRAKHFTGGLTRLDITCRELHAYVWTLMEECPVGAELCDEDVTEILGTVVAAVLSRSGWDLHVVPERFPRLTREGRKLEIFDLVHSMTHKHITEEEWFRICDQEGIGSINIKRTLERL
ncbi:MAG: M48 family metalloprotease [Spirochaetales bacterium]|nr:M48 family metalloprotease [Spirochaetales bacterium]